MCFLGKVHCAINLKNCKGYVWYCVPCPLLSELLVSFNVYVMHEYVHCVWHTIDTTSQVSSRNQLLGWKIQNFLRTYQIVTTKVANWYFHHFVSNMIPFTPNCKVTQEVLNCVLIWWKWPCKCKGPRGKCRYAAIQKEKASAATSLMLT